MDVETQEVQKVDEKTTEIAATEEKAKETKEETKDSVEDGGNDKEFGYLQRNEFTSEIYKIEVRNMGYFGMGEFKKLIKNKLKLDMAKVKSPLRKEFAFVCFRSQEDQEKAIQLLNGYKWKGKVLQATVAKASADPLQRKRKEDGQSEEKHGSDNKKQRTSADATCPLAHLSYEEQLKKKYYEMEELIKKFTHDLKKINRDAKPHLENFKYEGALASPQINGYRNKNEFTVGKNSNGEIVVGFRLGSYADGSVEVAEVESLPHIPKAAKWAAKTFQDFVKQSKFQPFNPEGNTGHFRQIMVRTSKLTNELMLVPGIYTSNLTEDELKQVKEELIAYYENLSFKDEEEGVEKEYKCTSLYYQDVKHREVGQMVSPVVHLSGTTHIRDSIQDLEFRISPLAFFQINTASANVLYQNAIDLAAPKAHSTVLDICCGTGTIALAFAKHCKQVLGVEIIPDAIKDAEYNAEKNGITNCKFYAGNADDYIQSMVREVVYGTAPGEPLDLVAVVDPPRAGLHQRSILAIRAASAIKRLVYISCNPHRAQRNWIELGRPESKQYKGEPFYPVTAVAVDMFPHTTHTEMIVLFERKSTEEKEKQKENETKAEGDEVVKQEQPTEETMDEQQKESCEKPVAEDKEAEIVN
ncbi:tRNA (uracil-5-)-methyltransferase homolog A [Lucilia cuprina]|uniref:tRNA (uracil-5-)-methyltransferase homolog A n=1 Tax=Lucilia cuprina TaxID=7375 RepID=UPI001F068456|nr:tRNA (uracil-5-)-methyltransferase homolog A [Lucilia cuprina]XP_046808699.1 tRNA (uracil-5-)-methyltransferase homolog A [Lucilia cuprina]XP_046808700.1 tRNA (uracil-5-)-methyltransferase homolog A [Lucilia cuprina]